MKRNIVNIDEAKCNGCGLCAKACHEGAIEIINGKAKLVSDEYCDGLGDCLPECPTGAITIVEKETVPYDEDAVERRKEEMNKKKVAPMPCGCPGTAARKIERKSSIKPAENTVSCQCSEVNSELMQWPVQLKLVNTKASYFENADLLIAADCTAYAYANFHRDFIKGHITVIGCPKLDDNEYYVEKLTEILKNNNIKSITVVRMEVPCCNGIINAAKKAMLNSETIVPYKEVVVSTEGKLI
ncbi:electron transport complex subunit RsxB [Clostridium acetireducens DSM 10703]|jgi:ferredoxin|uniref:Electron transport complex subunit RsxB n=1 Tax=Clostridium acetireducens DSM 10703 TaxID=1121290 RepID=A0A1E8EZ08_9CLOT|nr:4Fe-4S binding protein [Clostridium acetireducens]OFI05912.1 electron transport complex subunit RsxB [Clostridium acetireducens DSM 10703]